MTRAEMSRMLPVVVAFSLMILCPLTVISVNLSLNDDVLGLIVFKDDIQDPEGKLASWDEYQDNACNFAEVKCSPISNRVVEVNLDGFSFSGHLDRGLLHLEYLRKLSLARNNLTGSINSSIVGMQNFRVLDLSENGFSGTFNLSHNHFQGELPVGGFFN